MDHSAWGLVRRNNGSIFANSEVHKAQLNFPAVRPSERLNNRIRAREARNARHVA